jgi:predicted MFS family arabinose efflux permease
MTRRSLGRDFGLLWAAASVSALGTWLAFDALSLIAILVLHAGPAAVSVLASAGLAAGALLAVPAGPWVEFRHKRAVMVGADLTRFAAMLSIPLAYGLGGLSFGQLLAVSVVVATADIAFKSASGACLKALVRKDDLLEANGRLEATNWAAIAAGPPLGGLLIGLFGPVTTVVADAVSYLLSAAGLRSIRHDEPPPERTARAGELTDGWRHILRHPLLRRLFANTVCVNALIMATAPLMAVLMLGRLGFAPWQYGLAFGVPCVGGLAGARLSGRLLRRFGAGRVLRVAGTLRACWSLGLAFVGPGAAGLALVVVLQLGIVSSAGIFTPVYATTRLAQTPTELAARTLSAWSVTSTAAIAALTALWGVLAASLGLRTAIALAGLLLLATPLLLPGRQPVHQEESELTLAA